MKKLIFASLFVALFSCSDSEIQPESFVNKVEFSVEGDPISLNFYSFDQIGSSNIDHEGIEFDSIRLTKGIGVARTKLGEVSLSGITNELRITAIKTFSTVNPGVEIPSDPPNHWTYSLIHSMFSGGRPLIHEDQTKYIKGTNGIYISYSVRSETTQEYETFLVMPSVEIDNEIRYSTFVLTETIEDPVFPRNEHDRYALKARGAFDLYMRSESSGEIIHLENGEFTLYFPRN